MLIPKNVRRVTYEKLLQEGVLVAKKDFNAPKHCMLPVRNLYVIKLMQSLTSKGHVRTNFSWRHYYYFLTNSGIEYLREYLHVPEDVVPATMKKPRSSGRLPARSNRGGDRYQPRRYGQQGGDKKVGGAPGNFQPGFRGGDRNSGSGYRGDRYQSRGNQGGFGRGAPQQQQQNNN